MAETFAERYESDLLDGDTPVLNGVTLEVGAPGDDARDWDARAEVTVPHIPEALQTGRCIRAVPPGIDLEIIEVLEIDKPTVAGLVYELQFRIID